MNKEFLFTPEEIAICEDRLINAFGLAKRAGKCQKQHPPDGGTNCHIPEISERTEYKDRRTQRKLFKQKVI